MNENFEELILFQEFFNNFNENIDLNLLNNFKNIHIKFFIYEIINFFIQNPFKKKII